VSENATTSVAKRRLRAATRDVILFTTFYFVAAADITSIQIGGGGIRLAWAALPLLLLLLPAARDDRFTVNCVAALFLVHIVAALASGEFFKGFVYSVWILINYVCFFRAGFILSRKMGDRVWDAFLIGGRIQVVLGIAMVAAGLRDRTQFIYFEASYFAIGLVPYMFSVVFWSRIKPIDYALLIAALATNQSANMLIALVIAVFFGLISNRRFKTGILMLLLVPALAYAAFQIVLRNPSNPNYGLFKYIESNGFDLDLFTQLAGRTGNRFPRIQAALDVLDGHWWLGIGPGRYVELTQNMNFDYISGGLPYFEPAGLPVINVLLEATASAGLVAAAILVVYSLYLTKRVLKVRDAAARRIMLGALIALFIMLQIESSYLRAYVWFTFGVFLARTGPLRPGHPGNRRT
jgi:O-antigen ligase